MRKTIEFQVSGRVQGVFFRASTLQQACKLSLCGWVRNCKNGDVAGVASGDMTQIESFSTWLKQGPAMANVQKLEIIHCDYQHFEDFIVRQDD
jgi:acylphosphatase